MQSNTAATGLALLALLGAGHTHDAEGRYREPIDRGLKWLRSVQEPSGELFIGGGGEGPDVQPRDRRDGALRSVWRDRRPRIAGSRLSGRSASSSVPRTPTMAAGAISRAMPGIPRSSAGQMICLRSGSIAGIPVPAKVINGCRNYLDAAAADAAKSTYAYRPGNRVSPVDDRRGPALPTVPRMASRLVPPSAKGAAQVYKHSMTSGERNVYYLVLRRAAFAQPRRRALGALEPADSRGN